MYRAVLVVVAALMLPACASKSSNHNPAGTPTNPVTVCKRAGQVCELHGSVLGVCVISPQPHGKFSYKCQPQH